jgi:hypothetical protein
MAQVGARRHAFMLTLSTTKPIGFFPALRKINLTPHGGGAESYLIYPGENATVTMVLERQTMLCDPYIASYQIDIKYTRSVESMTFNAIETNALKFNYNNNYRYDQTTSNLGNSSFDTPEYKDWLNGLPAWNQKAMSRAFLDSISYNCDYQWYQAAHRNSRSRLELLGYTNLLTAPT